MISTTPSEPVSRSKDLVPTDAGNIPATTVERAPAVARYLSRAPISEALIDIRAEFANGFRQGALEEARALFSAKYPIVEARQLLRATLQLTADGTSSPQPEQLGLQGYVLRAEDGRTIVQVKNDGFTFSRLKPYMSWDSMLPEALQLWDGFAKILGPVTTPRLAVRYVNPLSIPLPVGDIADYLTVPPVVPPGAPQYFSSFMSRIVVEQPEADLHAIVTQALLDPSDKPNTINVLLDIDAFKFSQAGFPRSSFGEIFESLRHLKNSIFFGSITEATARRYE